MKSDVLRPDGFAITLFALGAVMLLVPMMRVPGIVAILAAFGYWLTMTVAKFIKRSRS